MIKSVAASRPLEELSGTRTTADIALSNFVIFRRYLMLIYSSWRIFVLLTY